MSHNITEVDTFTTTVTVPDGTDSHTLLAEYMAAFVQALANRTKNLNVHGARVDVANTFTLAQTFTVSVTINSTGSTDAVHAAAAGTGRGVYATSANGTAVRGEALGGNNNGGYFVGHGSGVGCYAESPAGANSNAYYGVANGASPAIRGDCTAGTGAGVRGEAGGSSAGGDFVGGASSGDGVTAQAGAGNGTGLRATGTGTGAGVNATGGASGGDAVFAQAQSTGDAVHADTPGSGRAIYATAGSSGIGASISGGRGLVVTGTSNSAIEAATAGGGAAVFINPTAGTGPHMTLSPRSALGGAQANGSLWYDGTNLVFQHGGVQVNIV